VPEPRTPHAVSAHLEPGETRENVTYQPRGRRELITSAIAAAIGGTLASLVSITPIALSGLPWWWIPTIGVDVAAIVFSVPTVRTFIKDQDVFVIHKQTMSRADPLPAPILPESQTYKVRGELSDGPRTIYTEFDIADPWAWHKFCKAVAGGRNFSENEAVKRHKVPRSDWASAYREFMDRGWVTSRGERGTPQLAPVGKLWMRQFATTPPPA
jgi:hypothetical protein